jgi:hypothetical protein
MSVAPTNYITTSSGTQDLADIFQALPSGPVTLALTTDYNVPIIGDLNLIFVPISIGTSIIFNTDFQVSNGNFLPNTDLSAIFAAKIFTTSPTNIYSLSWASGYYTITLTGSGTITFLVPISNGSYVVVGGGGGGGSGGGDDGINPPYAGGGGSGGEVIYISPFVPSLNTPINVTIGNGGSSDNSGSSSSFNGTISIGGNPGAGNNGGASVNGGGGGGVGAIAQQFFIQQTATNGTNGVTNALGTFGGCGGGGGAEDDNFPPGVANPGTGGSGGGANGGSAYNNGNNGTVHTGGGGGGAGQVDFTQPFGNPGGTGGSGVVIIYFQYP